MLNLLRFYNDLYCQQNPHKKNVSSQKKPEYSFAIIFVFTMDDPVQYRSQHIFTLNRFPISKAFEGQT